MTSIALVERMPKPAAAEQFSARALGDRILDWMARVGEKSPAAQAAKRYAALNTLTDAQLAERGLSRDQLAQICFGRYSWT